MVTRRNFLTGCGGVVAISGCFPRRLGAQTKAITPVVPGREVDQFKIAQQRLLLRHDVSARSRYVKLDKPALSAHVLEAGKGDPVLFLHGGIATAAHFARLMSRFSNSSTCSRSIAPAAASQTRSISAGSRCASTSSTLLGALWMGFS